MDFRVINHPYNEIVKDFEITVQQSGNFWTMPPPEKMRVRRSWFENRDGSIKRIGDRVTLPLTNGDIIIGSLIDIRPIREDL